MVINGNGTCWSRWRSAVCRCGALLRYLADEDTRMVLIECDECAKKRKERR